jgi:hypothetical protein
MAIEDVNGLNIVIASEDFLCQMGPVWTPNNPPVKLGFGQSLYSPSRAFRLTMQEGDGNIVLQYVETATLPYQSATKNWSNTSLPDLTSGGLGYPNWVTFWATYTQDKSANYLAMQYDGNLVVCHEDGTRLGQFNSGGFPYGDNTGTEGNISAFLRLQDDGNLVLTAQSGQVIWTSNTSAAESRGKNV